MLSSSSCRLEMRTSVCAEQQQLAGSDFFLGFISTSALGPPAAAGVG